MASVKLESLALRFSNESGLSLLDQTLLPNQNSFISIRSLDHMLEAIQSLRVRGAPLIGIAASLFWSHWLLTQADSSQIKSGFDLLRASRPTAVNLMNNLDACFKAFAENPSTPDAALDKAIELFHEDQFLCNQMGQNVSSLIQSGDSLLTYCNTGGLATAGIGTALGGVKQAFFDGKKICVFASETRPLGQGARLTFFELQEAQIPSYLICDNTAGSLMQQKKIDKIFVGADRITANGDVANKIGTYTLAVLAKHHGIPFYVVAPSTTFDFSLPAGNEIQIEQRPEHEVLSLWNLKSGQTFNPGFDVTPADLITKIITEEGIFDPNQISKSIKEN